jgi:hypothetical protein
LGGAFRRVAWFWRGYEHISSIGECHNGRRHHALYEELDPEVQLRVLALLVHAWAASVKPLQRSRLLCRAGLNITRPDAEFVKASPLHLQTSARKDLFHSVRPQVSIPLQRDRLCGCQEDVTTKQQPPSRPRRCWRKP